MKVSSSKVGHPSVANTEAASTARAGKLDADSLGAKKADGKNLDSSEKVVLSQKVLDMQKIKELATPEDNIDEAKVLRLQQLIDSGKYKTDAAAIADRLVDEHLTIPS